MMACFASSTGMGAMSDVGNEEEGVDEGAKAGAPSVAFGETSPLGEVEDEEAEAAARNGVESRGGRGSGSGKSMAGRPRRGRARSAERREEVEDAEENAGAPTPAFGRTSPLGEVEGSGRGGCWPGQVKREIR